LRRDQSADADDRTIVWPGGGAPTATTLLEEPTSFSLVESLQLECGGAASLCPRPRGGAEQFSDHEIHSIRLIG
jgi:hypothetical protein